MQIDPHLGFNGNCEEAFKFYEKTFGGKIEFKMTYGESPMAAQSHQKRRTTSCILPCAWVTGW